LNHNRLVIFQENKRLTISNALISFWKLKIKAILNFVLVYLTSPTEKLQKPSHHQAILMAWILRFIILFCAVTLLIILIFDPHHDLSSHKYEMLISGLIIFFVIAYTLNYAGHYNGSAIVLVACATVTPWISLLFDPSILHGDFVPLTYLTFSILLSSIFLPTHITIALAVLQTTGVVIVFILSPATPAFNWFSFLAFIILTSVFSILSNSIIQSNMKQIESQTRREAHLQDLSIRDHLTNLFNRRHLEETLEREIQRAVHTQNPLGVIMLDVDHFKHINDSLGHDAGDIVLQELGKFLTGQVRHSDTVCRYGGDEFVLILPDASRNITKERAEHLRNSVKHLSVKHENPITITISQGMAVFPDDGSTVESILKSADTALYQAKHGGSNLVAMVDQFTSQRQPPMNRSASE
jgi:diguanylate cyclase (GGDEF)-like protein